MHTLPGQCKDTSVLQSPAQINADDLTTCRSFNPRLDSTQDEIGHVLRRRGSAGKPCNAMQGVHSHHNSKRERRGAMTLDNLKTRIFAFVSASLL